MSAFDDVNFEWRGQTFTIPANRMMGAIARIEDHVTMPELQRYGDRGTVPLSRLACAFGSVLRYAGANVSDEDVYAGIFNGGDDQTSITVAIRTLMSMMIPKNALKKATSSGNQVPDPIANASSPKPSNSRSGPNRDGARRPNSGRSRRKNSTGS